MCVRACVCACVYMRSCVRMCVRACVVVCEPACVCVRSCECTCACACPCTKCKVGKKCPDNGSEITSQKQYGIGGPLRAALQKELQSDGYYE